MTDFNKRAIIYLAWGEKYISEVLNSIKTSNLPDYDKILITDLTSEAPKCDLEVIRADFSMDGHLRKAELINFLPDNYDSYLFLDSDTVVISDIEMGFTKAELFGIAASPAPHYSLDHFWDFGTKVMDLEGVSKSGQLLYNCGVFFFSPKIDIVIDVFRLWKELALKYRDICKNDQPFLSLSMELLDFNPYTLSINYNYRGMGNLISGDVKIWHSHREMPKEINDFEIAWPPRRVVNGQVIFPNKKRSTNKKRSKLSAFISKRMRLLKESVQVNKLLNRNRA